MKSSFPILFAALAGAVFSVAVGAYSTEAGPQTMPGARPMDCAKAKSRTRCESLNKDIEACRDKVGDAWRLCMHQPMPKAKFAPPKPRDCDQARNKQGCVAHSKALEACKDKDTRVEHRECMAQQLPAAATRKN